MNYTISGGLITCNPLKINAIFENNVFLQNETAFEKKGAISFFSVTLFQSSCFFLTFFLRNSFFNTFSYFLNPFKIVIFKKFSQMLQTPKETEHNRLSSNSLVVLPLFSHSTQQFPLIEYEIEHQTIQILYTCSYLH